MQIYQWTSSSSGLKIWPRPMAFHKLLYFMACISCWKSGQPTCIGTIAANIQRQHGIIHVKCVLRERYATQDSDIEIRKAIADRRQATGESFADFSIDIEALAARMRRPMGESEVIEYLRNNMNYRLQDALTQYLPSENCRVIVADLNESG